MRQPYEAATTKITGHKTRAVFDRYHIVSPADLQEATRKLAGTMRAQSLIGDVDGAAHVGENASAGR